MLSPALSYYNLVPDLHILDMHLYLPVLYLIPMRLLLRIAKNPHCHCHYQVLEHAIYSPTTMAVRRPSYPYHTP